MTKRRGRLTRFLKLAAALFALACLIAAVDYRAYPYGPKIDGASKNCGENGLWLRYTWYFGQHTAAEERQLSVQLQRRQIRYAYFHVRSIGTDGKLEHRYANKAKTLTAALHRECPGVKLIAWAYVPYDGTRAVNLADGNTRKAMVSEAQWLTSSCGFDGVQWDVEPCPDGDPNFLTLLSETRAALPPAKLLSVASPMWEPAALRRYGWSDTYFARVSATCDQIAVMCYDLGFYMPRAYVWFVRQQAIHVTHDVSIESPNCRVLLGVPTYGDGLPSHNPRAETLANAVRGVREGLADSQSDASTFAGVAMFADYTTTAKDWDTYERLWLRR